MPTTGSKPIKHRVRRAMLGYRLGFGTVALIGVAGAMASLARRDDHI